MNKTMNTFKRIAINTGGGDAPGLNAVIHAVVHAAHIQGWEIHGIRDGFDGLLHPENYPDGGVIKLTRPLVRNIAHLGGTILGTSNHGNPFKTLVPQPDGSFTEIDRSDEVLRRFRERRLDALISVGGDGSLNIARDLSKKGLRVIGVPKTIDNDLECTMTTFGFDSAVSFATECIDRLHFTTESHRRVMVVEVLGRYGGGLRCMPASPAGRMRFSYRKSHTTSPKSPRMSNTGQRATTGNTPLSLWPKARSRSAAG